MKPLFPLKRDFIVSLGNYIECANSLASLTRTCLLKDLIDPKAKDFFEKALAELEKASHGEHNE